MPNYYVPKTIIAKLLILIVHYCTIYYRIYYNRFELIFYSFFPCSGKLKTANSKLYLTYFSPCSVSFVLSGEYIQYSPLINFRLIIPSIIHLQLIIPSNIHLQLIIPPNIHLFAAQKMRKKQHHEGNLALRITSILNH